MRLNDVLDRKNFFWLLKKKISMSQKWHFPEGVNSCFWSKHGIFSLFFSVKKGLEIRLNDVLVRKQLFLTRKTKYFNVSKIAFSKGFNPCFWPKTAIFFHYFFLLKIRLELRFNNVLDWKKNFFDYKYKIFDTLKNRIFPKGLTQAFGQKWRCFLYLFSVKTRLQIKLTDFVEKKETFFDYKNWMFQSP